MPDKLFNAVIQRVTSGERSPASRFGLLTAMVPPFQNLE
jgi:hypothetical protein